MDSQSPLLKLPRELRDAIHELVVLQQPLPLASNLHAFAGKQQPFISKAAVSLPCKQVHAEYTKTTNKVALSLQ